MSDGIPRIDMQQLGEWLDGEGFHTRLHYLDEVGSTNDELKRLAAGGAPAGTALIAGSQNAGRGRLGRDWHSPPGTGLYISILLRPSAPIGEWTRWTLAASVAATEAARQCSDGSVSIKWPNDLMHDGRKLGGLLAEMRTPAEGRGELVLGLGMNVGRDAQGFPGSLSDTAISIEEISSGPTVSREMLAAFYLREMAKIDRELERGGWPRVARRWLELAPQAVGCRVRVTASGGVLSYHGATAGLDPTGALLVIRDDDGQRVAVRDVCSVSLLENG